MHCDGDPPYPGATVRHRFCLGKDTLSVANELGETAVVLLGHASYYSRFGFVQARLMGIGALALATPRRGLDGSATGELRT